jgi:hypothetical protein
MANIADTLYRVYGSKETLDTITRYVKIGMTHREALEALEYKQPDVTEELAKSIRLFDDFSPHGGISHSNEHLNEFMEELRIPYGTPLENVNKALEECGIMPVDTDRFVMRGTVMHIEMDDDGFVDIQSDDAWSEQQDFITALKQRFNDDEKFRIDFRCEEPGCDYYVSNVYGAIYGEYVSDLDCETDYHETFEDLCDTVISYLKRNSCDLPPQWNDFSDLQEYCFNYNESHGDHTIFVHEFTIL